MAHCHRPSGDVLPYFVRQTQQSNDVGDRRTIFANRVGDLFLREMEFVGEPSVGVRLLHRIEIFALKVFDQRRREQPIVRDFADDDGDFEQAGALGRTPPAFASDDLVAALDFAHDDRLDDPVGANRARELFDLPFVHCRARLERIRSQQIGIDFERAGGRLRDRWRIGNERAQAAAERWTFLNHSEAP